MALLILPRVGLCVGQNQMCHFVRLAFRVVFLSVYCCSVGRHRVATNICAYETLRLFGQSFVNFHCVGSSVALKRE